MATETKYYKQFNKAGKLVFLVEVQEGMATIYSSFLRPYIETMSTYSVKVALSGDTLMAAKEEIFVQIMRSLKYNTK